MTNQVNDHGWTALGHAKSVGGINLGGRGPSVSFGRVPDRRTCACSKTQCCRIATQEDFLCGECRETCT